MLKSWLCDNKVLTLLTLLGMDSNKNQSITPAIVFFSHIPWCWKMSSVRGKLKRTSINLCLECLQTSVLGSSDVGHTVDSTRLFDMTWFPPSTQLVRKHFLLPSKGSTSRGWRSLLYISLSPVLNESYTSTLNPAAWTMGQAPERSLPQGVLIRGVSKLDDGPTSLSHLTPFFWIY